MSDKGHFHLSSFANKQNFRYRRPNNFYFHFENDSFKNFIKAFRCFVGEAFLVLNNLQLIHERPFHCAKMTVLGSVQEKNYWSLIFFQNEQGQAENVNAGCYRYIFQHIFLSRLVNAMSISYSKGFNKFISKNGALWRPSRL